MGKEFFNHRNQIVSPYLTPPQSSAIFYQGGKNCNCLHKKNLGFFKYLGRTYVCGTIGSRLCVAEWIAVDFPAPSFPSRLFKMLCRVLGKLLNGWTEVLRGVEGGRFYFFMIRALPYLGNRSWNLWSIEHKVKLQVYNGNRNLGTYIYFKAFHFLCS